jgi:hypothetical protein
MIYAHTTLDAPNDVLVMMEGSNKKTSLESLGESLRQHEQALTSSLGALVECRRQMDHSRMRCQRLLEAKAEADEAVLPEINATLDEEIRVLDRVTYDYLNLLEEERHWLLFSVQCLYESQFPKDGLWRSLFTETLWAQDMELRSRYQERRQQLESQLSPVTNSLDGETK